MKKLLLLAIIALPFISLTWGCNSPKVEPVAEKPAAEAPAPGTAAAPVGSGGEESGMGEPFAGTVAETMNAAGYTYVRVEEGGQSIWAAAPQFTVAAGDDVVVPAGMPMIDYHSNTLDRTFDVVFFVPSISVGGAETAPAPAESMTLSADTMPVGHPSPAETAADTSAMDLSGIEKAKGGYDIAEIFSRKAELAGQNVIVRGKIVKFSPQIMGKNWIHLQDGTDHEGANDLTITTAGSAAKGDIVTVSGILEVDKDFGAGYKYDVIIENAAVAAE